MSVKMTQHEYQQALERGHQALSGPHAVSARYISRARVLELIYSNGLILRIDPQEISVLKDLPRAVLMRAEVTPGGDGLVFGENDAEAISIPGLVARMIPVDVARRTVAAARGRTHSAAKAEAARRNGAKGGRPARVAHTVG